MSTLTEAFREYRSELLAAARKMAGDDVLALMLLDLASQGRHAISKPRIVWCAGVNANMNPREAGPEGLEAVLKEYSRGADTGPDEQLSEAARYRKQHPALWLEFQA